MKTKIVSMILISLFLTACSAPAQNTPSYSDSSSAADSYVDGYAIVFDEGEYDEYLEHFKTAENVPEEFVYYEQLRELGAFKQFYAVSNYSEFVYDVYYYTLTDQCGHEFAIKIQDKKPSNSTADGTAAVDPQDMRYLPGKDKGYLVYYHDEVRYSYSDGQLSGISWMVDDRYFSITFEPGMLSTFGPEHSGTIIDGFRSLDTASATYNAFAEQVKSAKLPE